ncbi:family 76 glycoside hydrolase [Melampsora americana]|nr:family 76 glycoside hydrolase [Melampsora americana]
MRFLRHLSTILLWKASWAQAASYSPALDVTNPPQLFAATTQALKNLLTYYIPTQTGVFPQAQTPWHESGMIWGMFFDYAKWTGDTQFLDLVTDALVNISYVTEHDFLGGSAVSVVQTILGVWNDDVLWPSQVTVGGAEVFGPNAIMPRSNGDWISLATKTYDQTGVETDDKCGGGIYWSRDRGSPSGVYKSLITQIEFISQGARNYLQTKNETALAQSKTVLDWIMSSGLGNLNTGELLDGMPTTDCTKFTKTSWSYNYGQLIGSLAWMNLATKNQTYLDMISPFFDYSVKLFAPTGVITERCEADVSCNRDQQGFKAIYARNLVYVYRQTTNATIKNVIQDIIDASVKAMVSNSCDKDWNCGGNWTTDTQPLKYIRSQHVSAALLVSAIGIHGNASAGLLPDVNSQALGSSIRVSKEKAKKGSSASLKIGSSRMRIFGLSCLLAAAHVLILIH